MNILDKVKESGLIFDGAMGSMLIAAGLKGGKISELWNLENPQIIEDVHKAYFDAGSHVAVTNSFGASPFKLKKMGIDADPEKINMAAVEIAKRAAGPDQYVAGDMGPLGEMLQPAGLLTEEEAEKHYVEQAGFLAEGIDFFILETFFDLNEILAAIRAIRSISDLPIFATMTFQQKPTGFFTLMGNKPGDSMNKLVEAGASVVGANCSLASDTMVELAKIIRDSVDVPVMIQPNAGAPKKMGDTVIYPETVDYFCNNMMALKEMGVDVVGGCCGTTPDFIRAIADKIAAG
ncbi:5-methyltetrahydrofolate--homocysteine methyltransferase [Desulfocicer vacuolatum DSM 3385]|uniref:5-methyltetrahydrofolate--homocysteine methyltransferase n=2 Tax=Desulfocicer vacuolatum TaxID=2298 RepID=A0A1W2AIJ9_9BACT|nr:5-methyltetrahydrofolate--homocysteine methyltransferase [Desulfocicer vacuolatum DSM 3385]